MIPKEKAIKALEFHYPKLELDLIGKAIDIALKEVYDRAVSPEWGDVQFRKWVRNSLKEHTREKDTKK